MPKSLTAAVERMELGRQQSARQFTAPGWNSGAEDSWQSEAWDRYRTVGELSAVCRWMGSSAARVTLFAAEVDDDTGRAENVSTNPVARDIVADMAGGAVGQSDILRQAAVLLTVCGEFYVVILYNEETDEEVWRLVAPDRVKQDAQGTWQVTIDGEPRDLDPEQDSIFRVWDRDPRYPEQATSSVRAALPVLREIRAMDKVIAAAARSRVAGNGILIIPSEANVPDPDRAPRGGAVGGVRPPMITTPNSASNMARALSATMKKSLDDPGSSAAVTPIVITAPKETAAAFKHLRLDSEITEQAVATRERAIRRLALSLDIPPEILTGLGDSTHWNASLVDESALRQHIAPMMSTICEAMTTAVLQPMLGDDQATEIIVGFDMSSLSQKQDKSDVALQAYAQNAISVQALRRELGFDEQDAPQTMDEPERLRALAERMVAQSPSLLPYLAGVLGFPADAVPTNTDMPLGGATDAVQ